MIPNKEWETIRNTIKLSASECIGYLKKRQNQKCMIYQENDGISYPAKFILCNHTENY